MTSVALTPKQVKTLFRRDFVKHGQKLDRNSCIESLTAYAFADADVHFDKRFSVQLETRDGDMTISVTGEIPGDHYWTVLHPKLEDMFDLLPEVRFIVPASLVKDGLLVMAHVVTLDDYNLTPLSLTIGGVTFEQKELEALGVRELADMEAKDAPFWRAVLDGHHSKPNMDDALALLTRPASSILRQVWRWVYLHITSDNAERIASKFPNDDALVLKCQSVMVVASK